MTDRTGVIILVQSSLPPSPTSITAISTFISAKSLNAKAVVISKNEGWSGSKKALSFSTKSITYFSLIVLPLTLIRSRKSTRCGEVYRPTLYPATCRIDANVCETEPYFYLEDNLPLAFGSLVKED